MNKVSNIISSYYSKKAWTRWIHSLFGGINIAYSKLSITVRSWFCQYQNIISNTKWNTLTEYPYLIIMHRANSSCSTLSMYIISKSDTIAPLITMISSPLIMPMERGITVPVKNNILIHRYKNSFPCLEMNISRRYTLIAYKYIMHRVCSRFSSNQNIIDKVGFLD